MNEVNGTKFSAFCLFDTFSMVICTMETDNNAQNKIFVVSFVLNHSDMFPTELTIYSSTIFLRQMVVLIIPFIKMK